MNEKKTTDFGQALFTICALGHNIHSLRPTALKADLSDLNEYNTAFSTAESTLKKGILLESREFYGDFASAIHATEILLRNCANYGSVNPPVPSNGPITAMAETFCGSSFNATHRNLEAFSWMKAMTAVWHKSKKSPTDESSQVYFHQYKEFQAVQDMLAQCPLTQKYLAQLSADETVLNPVNLSQAASFPTPEEIVDQVPQTRIGRQLHEKLFGSNNGNHLVPVTLVK